MCVAAYAVTQLAETFEDQEIFRALHGIKLISFFYYIGVSVLLKMLLSSETLNVPIEIIYNFMWALGVVINGNTSNQLEVSNFNNAVPFFVNLAGNSCLKLRRKSMLIVSGLCQDASLRQIVRHLQVCS